MAINSITNFTLKLKTNPNLFEFEEYLPGIINKFEIKDSLFEYFPRLEFSILDDSTKHSEEYFFTEFLNINIELQDVYESTIKHNFYLNTQELSELLNFYYITGEILYSGFSDYFKQDSIKSKSYNMNISDIVRLIISQYEIANFVPSFKISSTSNFDKWYQVQEYDYEFIKKISKFSLNINNKNSPYYTFLNLNGDFYFYTVSDLLEQNSVFSYYLNILNDDDLDSTKNYSKILNYEYLMMGSSYNVQNYNSKIYNVDKSGSYNLKKVKLDEKIQDNKIALNKLSIRKQYLNDSKSYRYYGIIDNPLQENHYKGWINSKFINSISFPYRMSITVMFNAKLSSGKIIELYVNSTNNNKNNKAYEYSGNWLILECTHKIDLASSKMISVLLLGKSSVKIYEGHKFYFDFI